MKRKHVFLLTGLFLLALVLSGCGEKNLQTNLYDRYKMDSLQDCAYALPADTAAVCVYDNKIYAANDAIGYYDMQNNMAYTEIWHIPEENELWMSELDYMEIGTEKMVFLEKAPAIMACDNGVWYAYTTNVYHIRDEGGELLFTCPLDVPENANLQETKIFSADRYTYVFYSYSIRTEEGAAFAIGYMVLEEDGIVWSGVLASENVCLQEICALIPVKKNTVSIVGRYQENADDDEIRYGIFTLNGKTGNVILTSEVDGTNQMELYAFAEADALFACTYVDSVWCYGKKQENKDFFAERNLSKESIYHMICDALLHQKREPDAMGANFLCYTGENFVLWDYSNCVIIFFALESEYDDVLTVLAPAYDEKIKNSGYMSRDTVLMQTMFEQEKNAAIHMQVVDASLFNEKLRLKMLAGENDYDIVLLEDAPEILPSILQYTLYLPLEENDEIREGFTKYIDGIENVMTYEGHIFGIPYAISGSMYGVRPAFSMSGLTIPEYGYSLEQFWELCDAAAEINVTLANDLLFFTDMMTAIVEDGLANGTLTAERVCIQLEKFQNYKEDKVLARSEEYTSYFKHLNLTCANGEEYGDEVLNGVQSILPVPTVGGKNYYTVESMTFVSSATQNPTLAKAYIAYMLTNDYPALLSIGTKFSKSLLYRKPSSYYYAESGKFSNDYGTERIEYQMSEYQQFILTQSPSAFANAAPAVYTAELENFFRAILQDLEEGTLTTKAAAERIVSEVKYRFEE